MANKTRLRVLSARQELLDSIFEAARARLGDVTRDKGRYEEVLKGLLLEGFYRMDEVKGVLVRAKEADYAVVKKALQGACREFKENMGREIEVGIDEKNSLPEECAGGICVVGGGGKIDINNTFEERLKLLEDSALPAVRTTLFGPNHNRKFYD